MFDSTPDTSRQDQLSQIIRIVETSETGCCIQEFFIDFVSTNEKTGEGLTEVILPKLAEDKLTFTYCRGQGYDNGSNMSGYLSGVQARICENYPQAKFFPCAAHSLNRVGVNAAEKCLPAKLLLGQIQNIYSFFSSSTSRWNILTNNSKVTLKGHSDTRWSSKAKAVNTLFNEYPHVIESLQEIIESEKSSAECIAGAESRLKYMLTFKFLLGLCIWTKLLTQINLRNELLQTKNYDVAAASHELNILCSWLNSFKLEGFDKCLSECEEIAEKLEIEKDSGFSDVRRGRGINPKYDKPDRVLTVRSQSNLERFKCEFFDELTSNLISEMRKRFKQITGAKEDFGFLWGEGLFQMELAEKEKCAKDLCLQYPNDLDQLEFITEIQSLPQTVQEFVDDKSKHARKIGPLEVLNILHVNGLASTYSNCEIALRIFLTLPVSVASNERCFSKLKLIKNYLRSSMGQERLCGLAIISIEKEISMQINFEDVVKTFALQKCRKVPIM